jgi:tRNA nucleotidyltransferase (CCA-adding enzyme)
VKPSSNNLLQRLDEEHRQLLQVCGEAAAAEQASAWLVGGSVRDLLLARAHDDLDIVIEGDGLAVAQRISRAVDGELTRHHAFQTATVATPQGHRLDVATARSEDYPRAGQLPQVAPGSLAEDLARRDFSINAMAISLGADWGAFVDPEGGRADLEAGRVRVMHSRSFADDPTRILRALRFALRFGYAIEAQTQLWLREAVTGGYLEDVSGDRVRKEIRLMFSEAPVEGPSRLQREGVLESIHAGLTASGERLERLAALHAWYDGLSAERRARPVAPWVLVLTACAAGLAQQDRWNLVRRLRLSREERAPLLDAGTPLQRARDELDGGVPDSRLAAALAGLADGALLVAAAVDPAERPTAEDVRRYLAELRGIRPALSGQDLQDLGVPQGPLVGSYLERLRAARIDGDVADAADERRLIADWLAAEPR